MTYFTDPMLDILNDQDIPAETARALLASAINPEINPPAGYAPLVNQIRCELQRLENHREKARIRVAKYREERVGTKVGQSVTKTLQGVTQALQPVTSSTTSTGTGTGTGTDIENSFALSGDAPALPIDLPPEEKKPRKRNPLFDAVGSADGDVDQLTKSAKGRVAKALQEITGALPSVTPEEIYRRIGNLKTYFDGTGVTSTSLAKNWAKCDNPIEKQKKTKNSSQGNPYT